MQLGIPLRGVIVDLDSYPNRFKAGVAHILFSGYFRQGILPVVVRLEVQDYDVHYVFPLHHLTAYIRASNAVAASTSK